MIRWILLLALLAAVAIAAALVADVPGAVTLTVAGYRVSASAPVLALGLLLFAAAVAALYQLALWLRRTPGAFGRAQRDRRRRRAFEAMKRAMIAIAAGDASAARHNAHRLERLLEDGEVVALLSAQAAALDGDAAAAAPLFAKLLEAPGAELVGVRGLLAQAIARQDQEEALKLAERGYALNPKVAWVNEALYDLRKRAGQWGEAEALLEAAGGTSRLPAPVAAQERAELLTRKSLEAVGGEALALAKKAVKADPGYAPATARLAQLLIADGRLGAAADAIEEQWRVRPDPEVLEVYWFASEATDALKKLQAAVRLAKTNPDDPESRIAVAQAALEARMWGEARASLSPIAGDDASARVCRLMAQLEEAEHGDFQRARGWLARAAGAAANPAPAALPPPPAALARAPG